MSRYWHKRRYNKNPDQLMFPLLVILVMAIAYPPVRQIIASVWYIYAFAILVILAIAANKIYHRYKLSKAGIYQVDKMSGQDFELQFNNYVYN